jgi:hypothetical protein
MASAKVRSSRKIHVAGPLHERGQPKRRLALKAETTNLTTGND